MKMFVLVLTLFLLSDVFAEGEDLKCFKLESKTLGCVPAPDHPCMRVVAENAALSGSTKTGKCYYYQGLSTHFENINEGPIAFKCKTEKPPTCTGGEEPTCTPSECDVPFPPTCKQQCMPCVVNKIHKEVTYSALGCKILCRGRCSDEPYWQGVEYKGSCDVSNPPPACKKDAPDCVNEASPQAGYIGFKGSMLQCGSVNPCPNYVKRSGKSWVVTTSSDPNRVAVEIETVGEGCSPEQPLPPPARSLSDICPWVDKFGEWRKKANGGFTMPGDCKKPTDCCKYPQPAHCSGPEACDPETMNE